MHTPGHRPSVGCGNRFGEEVVVGPAIGQMLSSAVGVAISPLPLIVLILMLATPRGRANGVAFTLAWMVALAVVGLVMLVIGGGAHDGGETATWTYWLKLAM